MSYDPYPDRRYEQPAQPRQYGPPAYSPGTYPDPQYAPGEPPQAPPRSKPMWHSAALAMAVLLLATAGWFAYDRVIKKDSGIAACEGFRSGAKIAGAPEDKTADGKMTEVQYRKLRGVFEGSRHDDIKAAGTKMMDVLWQVQGLGPNPGFEALPYVGQMMSVITEMQTACANHGIVIDMSKLTAKPASTESTLPKCSDIFQDGKVIDRKKMAKGCADSKGDKGFVGDTKCRDGRHLLDLNSIDGGTNGWGWDGEKFHATEAGVTDAGYGRALSKCL